MNSDSFPIVSQPEINNLIYFFRGIPVILDRDIAALYGVETKRLNEQVKRNIDRFPEDFMFQLNDEEFKNWKSQNATSNSIVMGARKKPYAFSETGVAMLSSVLKSQRAIQVNIMIMRAFVALRNTFGSETNILQRIKNLEVNQYLLNSHAKRTDLRIDEVLNKLENKRLPIIEGLFYDGQVFDAYSLISDLIRTATRSIYLIDNYVDDRVLKMLDKRNENVAAKIYTDSKKSHISQDLKKHNLQYSPIEVENCSNIHYRFLIIDDEVYLIGGSIKDLGKRIVAFCKLNISPDTILSRLKI